LRTAKQHIFDENMVRRIKLRTLHFIRRNKKWALPLHNECICLLGLEEQMHQKRKTLLVCA
jgi:hypothetical protein